MRIILVCVAVLLFAVVGMVDYGMKKIAYDIAAKLSPDTANCVITGDWEK